MHRRDLPLVVAAATLALTSGASAATFFGPTAYTSDADVPAGFYVGGPTFLDDFEDGSLDGGITASTGSVLSGPVISAIDSVDGDDGAIDGSGSTGASFFTSNGAAGILFTFSNLVESAGVVWTDGLGDITFSAFDGDGFLLGSNTYTGIPDASFFGETAEDRFFGVKDLTGIGAIFISNSGAGMEVDHIQHGALVPATPIPLPAGMPLLLSALGVGLWMRRRQT